MTTILDCHTGWHKIAFAFLKLSGKYNALNIDKKLRLQLYYNQHQTKKEDHDMCSIWSLWKKKKLEKYPSTLYVTIKSVISPNKIVEVLRSKTPVQREKGLEICASEQNKNGNTFDTEQKFISSKNDESVERDRIWSKSPSEIYKMPNKCIAKFYSYDEGCFVTKFSNDGLYLACAIRSDDLYCIIIYAVLTIKEIHKFPCHQGLIYSIRWSSDNSLLATSSADNTISVFNLKNCSLSQILPHPSFVYSNDINTNNVIASGCYDGMIRIWKMEEQKLHFSLFQELEGHKGYVTSVCFNKKANLFSADSKGVLIEWRKEENEWILGREIHILDLREVIINEIVLFPREKRLLVHSRDNTLRIVDVKSSCVLQCLHGALNKRVQTFCTISPCATYVSCGSENGHVYVWNVKCGDIVATYAPFSVKSQHVTIHSVEFHPIDNMMAVTHYGENLPILLYSHEKDLQETNINLVLNKTEDEIYLQKKGSIKETRLKDIITKNNQRLTNRFDFKSILRKMDDIISS